MAGLSIPTSSGEWLHPPSAGEVAFPVLWIGIVVVLTVALQSVGWWWSLHSFRRYVREHLRAHVPDFETDVRTVPPDATIEEFRFRTGLSPVATAWLALPTLFILPVIYCIVLDIAELARNGLPAPYA